MSPKDPDIVVLSSKPSLGPAGTNPFWAVLSCQKKKQLHFSWIWKAKKNCSATTATMLLRVHVGTVYRPWGPNPQGFA